MNPTDQARLKLLRMEIETLVLSDSGLSSKAFREKSLAFLQAVDAIQPGSFTAHQERLQEAVQELQRLETEALETIKNIEEVQDSEYRDRAHIETASRYRQERSDIVFDFFRAFDPMMKMKGADPATAGRPVGKEVTPSTKAKRPKIKPSETQKAIAEFFGVTERTIRAWLKGEGAPPKGFIAAYNEGGAFWTEYKSAVAKSQANPRTSRNIVRRSQI